MKTFSHRGIKIEVPPNISTRCMKQVCQMMHGNYAQIDQVIGLISRHKFAVEKQIKDRVQAIINQNGETKTDGECIDEIQQLLKTSDIQ